MSCRLWWRLFRLQPQVCFDINLGACAASRPVAMATMGRTHAVSAHLRLSHMTYSCVFDICISTLPMLFLCCSWLAFLCVAYPCEPSHAVPTPSCASSPAWLPVLRSRLQLA